MPDLPLARNAESSSFDTQGLYQWLATLWLDYSAGITVSSTHPPAQPEAASRSFPWWRLLLLSFSLLGLLTLLAPFLFPGAFKPPSCPQSDAWRRLGASCSHPLADRPAQSWTCSTAGQALAA